MPLRFLDAFPREIRDQIYTYILGSRSGAVTLSPWSIEVAKSLCLLRTCKQIHRECKDLIWYHNRLTLRSDTQLSQKFRSLYRQGPAKRIRLLRISLELLDRDELEWVASAAKALGDWCRHGRLESITIIAEWDKPRNLQEFKDIQNLRRYGEVLDGRLYKDSSTWTRMLVNTGWPRFCNWGKQKWFREMLMDLSGVNGLLLELHKGFGGGQLYVDGLLCFKDYLQIAEDYKLDPRHGEIRIVPGFRR